MAEEKIFKKNSEWEKDLFPEEKAGKEAPEISIEGKKLPEKKEILPEKEKIIREQLEREIEKMAASPELEEEARQKAEQL